MKSLWFKQCYVADILSEKKRSTIRKNSKRLPEVNEIVSFSVGPRLPFAYAVIVKKETRFRMSAKKRAEVEMLYGNSIELVKLTFRVRSTQTNMS